MHKPPEQYSLVNLHYFVEIIKSSLDFKLTAFLQFKVVPQKEFRVKRKYA